MTASELGPWRAAEEAGVCGCGLSVVPGDPVRSWGGEWLCTECGDDAPEGRPIADVPTGHLL